MENNKQQKLAEFFQKAKYEPERDAAPHIWQMIITREKHVDQLKLWVFSVASFVSLAGLVPAINILLRDLTKSGLYEYLSLIFENGNSIASYWKELAFSLAQSLPTMSIIFTLSLVFVFFLSLRYVMKQVGKNQFINLTTLAV